MKAFLTFPAVRFFRHLFTQFLDNGGIINASALTYTTLFAVVPLMTVSYTILAVIPSFQGIGEEVQGWIFSNFVPTTGEVVQRYLKDFTSQARSLTAVGIGFLVVTSIMMMRNIEVAFNRIWRVREQRKGMSSFLLYWAVLSLGPVLIGLGLLVTSYIASLPLISDATELVGKARLLALLPMLMSCAAFTLLYAAVPNCKVPLKHAFIGGLVVAVLFETAKRGFAAFVAQFPSYELIYGAFAAVPLFLVWIFISWVIILMGCELTRALGFYRIKEVQREGSHLHRIVTVLHRLWQAQGEGISLSDQEILAQVPGLDQSLWDEYALLLKDARILEQTGEGNYLLSRDMGALSLHELVQALPWPLPDNHACGGAVGTWRAGLDERLSEVNSQQAVELGLSLEQLFLESKTEPKEVHNG